jgi:hypothetical protein
MIYHDYLNHQFTDYLNRYLTGITIFKEKLEEIFITYELANLYGNQTCRFSINVSFFDYEELTDEERKIAYRYFENSWNSTGSQFVSFSYKPQQSYYIDVEEIKSFILHYQFAQHLFEGFIKNLLPKKCELRIAQLDSEPFFNYIHTFIRYSKYSKEDNKTFENEYIKYTNRDFEFDYHWHNRLLEKAEKYTKASREGYISDKELFDVGACGIVDIRIYVYNECIPFYIIEHSSVIDEIWIDSKELNKKIETYASESLFTKINPGKILDFILKKEKVIDEKQNLLRSRIAELGIEIGDYIFVEKNLWDSPCQDIGIAKDIKLGYGSELTIEYNVLNKNLTESKLSLRNTKQTNVSYSCKFDLFKEELKKASAKEKFQAIRVLKQKGVQNKAFVTDNKNAKKKLTRFNENP